jgi:hypothetical protein
VQARKSKPHSKVPKDAVLLIPEPDDEDESTCGVQPGYYDAKQMLALIEKHLTDPDAIQFIADMLETGDADNDGFVELLRQNHHDPAAIARIIKICST